MTDIQGPSYWAADVIVVGAGASGLSSARRLAQAGHSVLILEQASLGASQSNHSHGYMHRGHIYLRPSPALMSNLNAGADRWTDIMNGYGIPPVTNASYLGFSSSYEAEVAARSWARGGLDFTETSTPDAFVPLAFPRMFRTTEKTYDFTRWLEAMARELHDAGVPVLRAQAVSLERAGDSVVGVNVRINGELVVLRSRFVVLCAGTGNMDLAASITRYRGNSLNRTSYMMILQSESLKPVSLVAHGHDSRGLFIVSRNLPKEHVWLVSNYVSFAGMEHDRTTAALWARDVRRTLEKYTNVLKDASLEWGYYTAPKGELRNLRNSMDSHSVQRYGLENMLVASPTKLTLVPLLAELVTTTLSTLLLPAPKSAGIEVYAGPFDSVNVSSEMWKSVGLSPIGSLMTL